MANDSHASYTRIGFFIIAGVALVLGAVVWLGGGGRNSNEMLAETYFPNDVSGLDVGSTVNLRGVRVGSVKRISFVGAEYDVTVPEDGRKIFVLMSLDKRIFRLNRTGRVEEPVQMLQNLVNMGLHATVSASGVTGLSHIELNFPKVKVPDERPAWTSHNIVIPSAPSILQSVADSATQILDQINRMDLLAAWSNAVSTLESANATIGAFGTLLESNGGNIRETLDNLREASSSIRDFADGIRANPSALLRSSDPERLPETL
ncbi:MAG: MCE family protein [Kiritimatiellae bacterium]|nr:MCE family protein [Kiritimatiellia bacterium]